MSERNPVGFLDIRLVEEKLIDETILQDYRKVHEKLERLLDKVARPIDDVSLTAIEEQFLAWLFSYEARKDEGDKRLTSLLRCGLGHLALAIVSGTESVFAGGIVDRAIAEFRARGWQAREFDLVVAELAARKYPPLEKKTTPDSPASNMHSKAAGKTGARQRIQKEGSVMTDPMNAGAAPAPAESTASASAKPKTPRKPRAAAPEALAKKAAPAKKAAAPKKAAPAKKVAASKKAAPAKKVVATKKVAAKKPVAVKATGAAKKPAVKKLADKKAPTKKVVAAKKPVAKKAVAKKPAAAKAKPVAKKALAAKKPAAKVAAKKPATKVVAKKVVAPKKAAPKKTAK